MAGITIKEAIEILTYRWNLTDPLKNPEYENALKLGIEALKDKQQSRGTLRPGFYVLLPGETE